MEDTGFHSGQAASVPSVLERMARAMFDKYLEMAEDDHTQAERDKMFNEHRDGFAETARAALLAIREPDAAKPYWPIYEAVVAYSDCSAPDEEDLAAFVTAMIDTILAESPQ